MQFAVNNKFYLQSNFSKHSRYLTDQSGTVTHRPAVLLAKANLRLESTRTAAVSWACSVAWVPAARSTALPPNI